MYKSLKNKTLPVIGWREWIGLPDLGIQFIKAKVDTGARSSSIHAANLHFFEKEGTSWVRFKIYPFQRNSHLGIETEARVVEHRSVRSSSGKAAVRPVIITNIELLGNTWPVEVTLAGRDEMGFRMLLGREAFRTKFYVDAGHSFYGGRPKKSELEKFYETGDTFYES